MLPKRTCLLLLLLSSVPGVLCGLLIGAFNIKSFGDSKMSNATLADIIVKVVQRYDIILIQEVRDADLTATNSLMKKLNSDPAHVYQHIVSEPLGRSTYKERYLFVYRAKKVSAVSSFQYDDGCESCGTDTFNREPFVVKFASPFSAISEFAIIPQHTSPDEAVKEIDALYDVCRETTSQWKSDNILLMGDFNADCSYVRPSDWSKIRLRSNLQFEWLISDSIDTTVTNTNCAYDRIVAHGLAMQNAVVPGSANIYNFQSALQLSSATALAVSDHFPVEVELRNP
ncbi:deoxyribonuclease-1 [Polypterus senegalus]|uniref:deoxyribonuclease-1 n=1 Tax=Polypterus senegalus TaxID=55291 RepID=UPI001965036A|nr:deoxyribonuclease-1 [Polypterus senegalus]